MSKTGMPIETSKRDKRLILPPLSDAHVHASGVPKNFL